MLPQPSPAIQFEVDTGITNIEQTLIPAFVNLYRHLAEQILDHDASTLSKSREYEASGVAQRLREAHSRLASESILTRALKDVCLYTSKDVGLSREAREICYLISAYLSTGQNASLNVNNGIEDLMAGEILDFRTQLPTICEALSAYLRNLETTIVAMLEPLSSSMSDADQSQTPSGQTTRIPSLLPTSGRSRRHTTPTAPSASAVLQTCQQRQSQIETTILPDLLVSLSTTLSDLLTTQTELLTAQIRHAELYTHSSLARHLTSHATFLSTVSHGLSLKAQILALQREKEAYAEQGVRTALAQKLASLSAEERGMVEREDSLRGLLKEYHDAAEGVDGVFEKLGRGYREVEEEIELVRKDVERLERELEGEKTGVQRTGRKQTRR